MLFGLIETKKEKAARIKELDIEQMKSRLELDKQFGPGPFFGLKYEDDNRTSEEIDFNRNAIYNALKELSN